MGQHAVQRPRAVLSVVAAGAAVAVVAGILSVNGAATAKAPRWSENLVSNPGFESGNAGWNTQNPKARLGSGPGHDSGRAAQLAATANGAHLLLNDSPNIVQSAEADTRYAASVWIRSDTRNMTAILRFREVAGRALVGRAETKVQLGGGDWQQIKAEYVAARSGSEIAVQVIAMRVAKGATLSVDDFDVRMQLPDEEQAAPEAKPEPTKSQEPKPDPTKSQEPKPEPTPTDGAKTPDPVAKGSTLFGASVYTGDGTSFADALKRSNAAYGGLKVVRVFHPSLPKPWASKAGTTGGPVVVSFKANPKEVVTGKLDAFFKDWFNQAPRDRDIYWTNYHEPEDNIERGEFTAAQYREALRRLDSLADQAGNKHLKTATIWMCYDLKPGSGRDWRDYYPGSDVVDLMGWDCYNRGRDTGSYDSPASILDDLRKTSESMGKPWGLGEYASKLAAGDDGKGRAAWLRASADYAVSHDAAFVNYFDAFGGAVSNPEYRLLDGPSKAAWKAVVSGS
jgi:hypothetical protein